MAHISPAAPAPMTSTSSSRVSVTRHLEAGAVMMHQRLGDAPRTRRETSSGAVPQPREHARAEGVAIDGNAGEVVHADTERETRGDGKRPFQRLRLRFDALELRLLIGVALVGFVPVAVIHPQPALFPGHAPVRNLVQCT